MVGMGENAGVVDIGQGYAVTFKVESHNHPSYVEPYQGAATGVGGIVRDILAMGARPVAVMDPLRFGPLDADDTQRVLPGIVAGVGGYGNCLGLPNIGGEAVFDATYLGNPLVNALCVGVMRHEQLHLAKASGVGNQVILYGARTGGDGIGGVSVLASETFERPDGAAGPAKRPSVQVGDPFMEKLLIECTLELFAEGLVVGIQDLGGAGLSCATSELASAGDGGMQRVARPGPAARLHAGSRGDPHERVAGADDGRRRAGQRRAVPRDLREVGGRRDRRRRGHRRRAGSSIEWHGEVVVDVPPRTVAHDGPVYQRPFARPAWQDDLQADGAEKLPRPERPATSCARPCCGCWPARTCATGRGSPTSTTATSSATPSSPSPRTPGWSGSTTRPGSGSRWPPTATAGSPSSTRTPAPSSRWPRPTATSPCPGARPLAVSDCLNFGSPEDPSVMWQFAEAVRGLADGCQALGIPVTGGNVSLYNQTGTTAILPTPVVAVLGVDRRRHPADADRLLRGRARVLPARDDPRGAVRLGVGPRRARPPRRAAAGGRPRRGACAGRRAGRRRRRRAARSRAHDLSDGGLAQALVECVPAPRRGRHGRPARGRPVRGAVLRVRRPGVVSVRPGTSRRFTARCDGLGVPVEGAGSDRRCVPPSSGQRTDARHRAETLPPRCSTSRWRPCRASWTPTLRAALA